MPVVFAKLSANMATLCANGSATILDAETGAEIRQLRLNGKKIRTIAVTPDSKQAVTATEDMSITVWDLNTATEFRSASRWWRLSYAS